MYKEEKIASYTKPGFRAQLLRITDVEAPSTLDIETDLSRYQIRINRKVKYNCLWENQAKKKFAQYITNDLLQQKFSF